MQGNHLVNQATAQFEKAPVLFCVQWMKAQSHQPRYQAIPMYVLCTLCVCVCVCVCVCGGGGGGGEPPSTLICEGHEL